MEREQTTDRQIAVLIDFENVGLNSIQWLFDQLSDVGRVIIKRAYADWSAAGNKRDQLLELGIEAIQLFRSSSGGKNSSDIRLAIDAIDLLHTSPVDTFVIVSSDSDFVSLVNKLRAGGKIVLGAGEQDKAPHTLVKSCDRYYYLEQSNIAGKGKKISFLTEQEIENLVKRASTASIDEYGRVLGTKLRQTMQRLEPSFDYRSYGFSTFTKFIEAQPNLKLIRPKGPGDVIIEPVDIATTISVAPSHSGENIWHQIDVEWSIRVAKGSKALPGPVAAIQAAKVLGVDKLSVSQYKTLQGLLDSSDHLSKKWQRKANTIIRR
jgi:uncharacterized protein (TIGR00288 family)